MEFSVVIVLLATLLRGVLGAPTRDTNTQASATPFRLPGGSVQIASGAWFNNITMPHAVGTMHLSASNNHVNACGVSTFETRVSKASPLVQDCWKLHDKIAAPGFWTVGVFSHHQLVEYGTCAFGVNAHGGSGFKQATFYVGTEDVRDLINDSISLFHWEADGIDRVGTRGWMPCDPEGLQIEWGLYHD